MDMWREERLQDLLNEEKAIQSRMVKVRGGSRVIFACSAHMKVPFIAIQALFIE